MSSGCPPSSGSATLYAFQPRALTLLTRGHSAQPNTRTSPLVLRSVSMLSIIAQRGRLRYWPNGEHGSSSLRQRKDSRGATCRPGLDSQLTTHNIPDRVVGKTRPSLRNVASATRSAVPSVWSTTKENGLKGSQKPKSAQKKPAQKTLKERRSAKKAAAKIRGIAE